MFKVGDRVRVKCDLEYVGVIDSVVRAPHVSYGVYFGDASRAYSYREEELELVESPKFKPGDWVICRGTATWMDGLRGIVMEVRMTLAGDNHKHRYNRVAFNDGCSIAYLRDGEMELAKEPKPLLYKTQLADSGGWHGYWMVYQCDDDRDRFVGALTNKAVADFVVEALQSKGGLDAITGPDKFPYCGKAK